MKIRELQKAVEFTTNGDLSFFFVGTGSAFSKKNFQTNVLIIKGNDHILIDCGTLCPYALSLYNASITSVKNVFITHSHADHIGGLEEMALMGRYVSKTKPRMVISDYYKKILWEQSLKGGCSYGEYSDGSYMQFEDYFEQIKPKLLGNVPRPQYEVNIGSINLKMFRTKHIPDGACSWKKSFFSEGILVDDRILFPSDTRFDRELLDWMCGTYPVEYIFHDCQFYTGGVHASYDELKTLPEDMKQKMYLCHYGDNYEKFDAVKDGFAGFTRRAVYYDFEQR
jgi:Metal-dependent hydrolases of the beta-lactamase superfamily III